MKYLEKAAVIEEPYRYSLSRIWDASRPLVLWIMLNPSTADADQDDATIRKIVKISDNNGFGGLYVGNVYAYRTKDPSELFKNNKIDYIGQSNGRNIASMTNDVKCVIIACGHAKIKHIKQVIEIIHGQEKEKVYCLDYNKNGTPVHPLYQRDNSTFKVYDINRLGGK